VARAGGCWAGFGLKRKKGSESTYLQPKCKTLLKTALGWSGQGFFKGSERTV